MATPSPTTSATSQGRSGTGEQAAAAQASTTSTARPLARSANTLSSARTVVRWSGQGGNPAGYAPPAYTPQLCAAAQAAGLCDIHTLTLNLPSDTFTKPGDGVFIDIRWSTDFDQWNLFVFDPSGNLAASGFDLDSNAQGVLLNHPANGTYSIVAVPFYQESKMAYQGEARVFLDDTQRHTRVTTLLPRLWTAAPRDFHIECATPDPSSSETGGGCTDVPPLPSNPVSNR